MSAPTSLDGEALRVGIAWRVAGADTAPAAPGPERPQQLRSTEPVAILTREHDELCTQAADRFEIAAGLEAVGFNDSQARQEYGLPSVFELAERMYELVPRRPADPGEPARDMWRRPVHEHLVRGLLYGLPALLYVLAMRTLPTGTAAVVLLLATVASVALAQGLSVLGHALLDREEWRAARTLFLATLAGGGVALAGLTLLGGVLPSVSVTTGLLAGTQVLYLLAATVLLVTRADLLLLGVLVPGATLGIASLLGLADGLPAPLVFTVLAASLLATVLLAALRVRGARARSGRTLREAVARSDTHLASAFAVYGLATAGLLSYAAVDVLTGVGLSTGAQVSLAMLPLMAALGVGDWLLYSLRSRALALLHRTYSPREFRRGAARILAGTTAVYALVLGALVGVVCAALWATDRLEALIVLDMGNYAVLGLTFLLVTVLLSLGLHRRPTALTWAALGLDLAVRLLPPARENPLTMGALHLAVFLTLLVTLFHVTRIEYCRVARHR